MSFKFEQVYLLAILVLASCKKTEKATLETDFCSNIHRNDSTTLSQELADVAEQMFTKTEVVLKDGSKPSFLKIVMRSFLRLMPFDAFSYLFGSEIGLHNLLSSTRLSKEIKINSAQKQV